MSGTDDDESLDQRNVRPRLDAGSADNAYDASESDSDLYTPPSPSSSPSSTNSNDGSIEKGSSPILSASTWSPPAAQLSSHSLSPQSLTSSSPPSQSSSDSSDGRSNTKSENDSAEDSEALEAAELELYQNFMYQSMSSSSDGSTDNTAEGSSTDADYSQPDEPSSSSGSSDLDDTDHDNTEPSIQQQKYDIVVKQLKDLHDKKHLSKETMASFCDVMVLNALASGASAEIAQTFSTLKQLNKRYNLIVANEVPIGAVPQGKSGEIKKYAMCKKCDHLLLVKPVVDCQCGKEHDNLIFHKYDQVTQEKRADLSKICGYKSAPKAPFQRPCKSKYAKLDPTTGIWNPDKSVYMLSLKSFIKDVAKNPDFEADMKDHRIFRQIYGGNGNMPWDAPFWKELEERLDGLGQYGMLSEENWQNMVAFLTFDGLEKSKGHGGHGGKLCKYIKFTYMSDC